MQIDITTAVAWLCPFCCLVPGTHPAFPGEILNVRQWLVAIWPVLRDSAGKRSSVGIYLARVLEGERTWLDPVLRPSSGSSTSCAASMPTRR